MTLQEWIDRHHGGNQTDYARTQGYHQPAVNRWLKAGDRMVDDSGRAYKYENKKKEGGK